MSSCLVLQQKDKIFIGSDSILSVIDHGFPKRTAYEYPKLFQFGKDIIFCTGALGCVTQVLSYLSDTDINTLSHINIHNLSDYLVNHFSTNSKYFDIEILITRFEGNISLVYQLSPYNNYREKIFKCTEDGVGIITAGIDTEKVYENALNMIRSNCSVKDIFQLLYANSDPNLCYGGQTNLYELSPFSINQIIAPTSYNFPPQYSYHLVAADTIVGHFLIGENLRIQNKNNTFTIDQNGLVATSSANKYSLTINPDDPKAIFTIKKGTDLILGVNAADDKFVFKGTLESTDGHIGGWTIGTDSLTAINVGLASSGDVRIWAGGASASAPFRVKSDGSVYTNNIEVAGGKLSIGQYFSVDSNGVMKCSSAEISGKVIADSGSIGGFEIKNGNLSGKKGAQIQWGSMFIDGDSAELEDLMVNGEFYAGGLYGNGSGEPGTWIEADGGDLHTPEIYVKDSWWKGWSLTETVKTLWEYVYNGGWNPCKSDDDCDECGSGDDCDTCSDSCDGCDDVCIES